MVPLTNGLDMLEIRHQFAGYASSENVVICHLTCSFLDAHVFLYLARRRYQHKKNHETTQLERLTVSPSLDNGDDLMCPDNPRGLGLGCWGEV